MAAPTVLSDFGPVAGDHHDRAGCRPARSERMVRAASGRTGSSSTRTPAGSPSIATNTVSAPSSRARRRAVFAHRGGPVTPAQLALPTATRWPATTPRMPWPSDLLDLARQDQLACSASAAARTTALGQNVPGHLVQGRGQAQNLLSAQRASRDDGGQRRAPAGQRPGLVQQQRRARGQRLQHAAAFDDHAAARRHETAPTPARPGQPGSAGTAWRRPGPPLPARPRRLPRRLRRAASDHEQEPQGIPVGQPDERGLRLFCLAPGGRSRHRCCRRPGRSPQVERAPRVHRTAAHRVTLRRARQEAAPRSAPTHPAPPRPPATMPLTGTTSPGATSSRSPGDNLVQRHYSKRRPGNGVPSWAPAPAEPASRGGRGRQPTLPAPARWPP